MENNVLLGLQVYDEVYTIADEIAKEKRALVYKVEAEPFPELLEMTNGLGWAEYLYENAKLAIKALVLLALPYSLEDLPKVVLFGRFYPLLPNVTIDVGHNLLGAKAISKALEQKYQGEKIVLVYNTLDDKEYESIISEFKELIKHVEIIPIETQRAVDNVSLKKALNRLEIEYKDFNMLLNCENYFVFGSFYVVEAFLKKIEFDI